VQFCKNGGIHNKKVNKLGGSDIETYSNLQLAFLYAKLSSTVHRNNYYWE